MKVARIFFKIIFSLLLSLATLIVVIQEDPWAKKKLAQEIASSYDNSFDCSMQCSISSFNIFDMSISIEDIKVAPCDKDDQSWSWSAKKGVVKGSWWQFIKTRILELSCTTYDLSIYSDVVNDQFAINNHVELLFASPLEVPVLVKNFSVRHGTLLLCDDNRDIQASIGYNSHTILLGQKMKTALSVTRTDLKRAQAVEYISGLTGQLECDVILRPSGVDVQASGHLNFMVNLLPKGENTFILSGSWRDGSGFFDIHNDEYTIGGSIATVGDSLIAQTTAVVPLSYIENVMRPGKTHYTDGLLSINGRADLYDFNNFFEFKFGCENFDLKNLGFKKKDNHAFKVEVKKNEGVYYAHALVDVDPLHSLAMDFSLNDSLTSGGVSCTGTLPASFLYDESVNVRVGFDMSDKKLNGSCSVDTSKVKSDSGLQLKAELSGDLEQALFSGVLNDDTFSIKGCFLPLPFVSKIESYNAFDDELLNIAVTDKYIDARVSVSCIKNIVHHFFNEHINGEGFLDFKGEKVDSGLQGKVRFYDGALRIPTIYNGVTGLNLKYNLVFDQKSLVLKNVEIDLHKGSLQSEEIVALWDDGGKITYFSAPITMRDCFISHHKDFFAIISGESQIKKSLENTYVTSVINIDRAHLKGNVLEGKVQGDILMPSALMPYLGSEEERVFLDLNFSTKEPMRVKTPFLQTSASIQASLQGDINNLEGHGAIELQGGSISFPYKPLYISTGKIMLMPEQLDDPVIELRAKNTLKKYGVSVLASGTVKNPKISFTSTPALSEEQIITLLCTGSEDAGLISAVPSVIMHNIQQLIFGPAEEASSFSKYFQKIFRPFGNIRVVPTIGDSKEHPGLHASVEVDVNERIHGSVHKNLSAPEDTKIELEYALSDEMSIRGTRDERGDLSAEVEFRFSL